MIGEMENIKEGLEGELGYKGERGYSAYEIAVQNGYQGTEQEWIAHFGLDLSSYIKNSDVVNNLTSEYTTRPLSAAQGKELKNGIDDLDNDISALETQIETVHTYTATKETSGKTFTAKFKEKNGVVHLEVKAEGVNNDSGLVLINISDLPEWATVSDVVESGKKSITNQTHVYSFSTNSIDEYIIMDFSKNFNGNYIVNILYANTGGTTLKCDTTYIAG